MQGNIQLLLVSTTEIAFSHNWNLDKYVEFVFFVFVNVLRTDSTQFIIFDSVELRIGLRDQIESRIRFKNEKKKEKKQIPTSLIE